jgi:hypothetical protein
MWDILGGRGGVFLPRLSKPDRPVELVGRWTGMYPIRLGLKIGLQTNRQKMVEPTRNWKKPMNRPVQVVRWFCFFKEVKTTTFYIYIFKKKHQTMWICLICKRNKLQTMLCYYFTLLNLLRYYYLISNLVWIINFMSNGLKF